MQQSGLSAAQHPLVVGALVHISQERAPKGGAPREVGGPSGNQRTLSAQWLFGESYIFVLRGSGGRLKLPLANIQQIYLVAFKTILLIFIELS